MPDPKAQLASGLMGIWKRHRSQIDSRVTHITQAVALLRLGELTGVLRVEAGEDAHKLAGSLGTFGHPEGSEHARVIELAFLSDRALAPEDANRMQPELMKLQAAVLEISKRMDS